MTVVGSNACEHRNQLRICMDMRSCFLLSSLTKLAPQLTRSYCGVFKNEVTLHKQVSHCMLKYVGRLRLKCDGTRAETRFRLSAKRTSPFKSAGASVQSTTNSRDMRISGSNAGYTKFRGSVKGTGYPLPSPVFPSLPLSSVTVCHHISTGL
jgi:hypothetical protein